MPALRGFLLGAVFTPPAGAGPERRRDLVLATVLGIAAGLLQLVRQPGSAIDNPWAEDGRVFLTDAWQHPLRHEMFAAYNGYPAVYPRLVAALAVQVPVARAPLMMALGGAVATALAVAVVIVGTEGHVRSSALRGLLGAGVAVFPLAGREIAAATCNAQWWLMAAALFALVWRPRSMAGTIAPALALLTAASNDPLLGLFLPFAVLRAIALPRWRDNIVGIALLVGLAVQLPSLVHPALPSTGSRATAGELARSWLAHVPTAAVLGPRLAADRGVGAPALAAGVLLGALALAVVGGPRRRWLAAGALALSVPLYVVPLALRWSPGYADVGDQIAGSRYSLAPITLCLTVLVLGLDALLEHRRRVGRMLSTGLGAALLVAAVAGAGLNEQRTPSWSGQLPAARAFCATHGNPRSDPHDGPVIPVGDAGVIVSPRRSWRAAVPCSRLVAPG